jgi:hypothetical protein
MKNLPQAKRFFAILLLYNDGNREEFAQELHKTGYSKTAE